MNAKHSHLPEALAFLGACLGAVIFLLRSRPGRGPEREPPAPPAVP